MATDYLCNLVIPGAAKSGTSSLHDYLGAHPKIVMSTLKEPHHFCRGARYKQGAEPHNALFDPHPTTRYFGESSTGYLPWPTAAERMLRDLTDPKAIIVLRHPVARCFSHYRWRFRLGLENRSFLEAMRQDGFGYNPEKPTKFGYMAYLEFSRYAAHCPKWEDMFGAENCLIIAADDLLEDQQKALNGCFAFLGLEPLASAGQNKKINETGSLGRRPPKAVTRLAAMLPKGIRSSAVFQKTKDRILRAAAPEPPKNMTDDELVYVTEKLGDDIAWYENRFAKAELTTVPERPRTRD